jgi:hypothetical protein
MSLLSGSARHLPPIDGINKMASAALFSQVEVLLQGEAAIRQPTQVGMIQGILRPVASHI